VLRGGLALIAVAATLGACGGNGEPAPTPSRVGIPVNGLVRSLAFGEGSVWATVENEGTVVRIDPDAGAVSDSVSVEGQPRDVAVGDEGVWVATRDAVARIDPATNRAEVVQRMDEAPTKPGIAVGAGSVWAIGPSTTVVRIDASSGDVVATIELPNAARVVAFGEGSLWVGMFNSDVARVDPATNQVDGTTEAGLGPSGITVSPGAVWAVGESSGEVVRIEPEAVRVVGRVSVGELPGPIDADGDEVWVGVQRTSEIARIDPETNGVSNRISVDDAKGVRPFPLAVALGDGDVWVATTGGRILRVDPVTGRLGP